jgi:hypothetical protein
VNENTWPSLPLEEWQHTYATLHMWLQIVGKIALRTAPFINHWWEAALHVTPRGLRTQRLPWGDHVFEIDVDLVDHVLSIETDDGRRRAMALAPRTVADFYRELVSLMGSLGLDVAIDPEPKEVPNAIPFDHDTKHASYDREPVERLRRILVHAEQLLTRFRGRFIGKCSPVHFFWGSFDLTVTRFSGRTAPERPDADHMTKVAYSHEVTSVGWWPGSGSVLEPAFYAYAAPEPKGYELARVAPASAFYNPGTKGFILKHEDARKSPDPDATVLEFCQSTYEAAADLGRWDRAALERAPELKKRAA